MTEIGQLQGFVKRHGSQKKAAEALGISQPHLWRLLHGHAGFGDDLLAKLGLERVTRIRKLAKSA